MCVGVRRWGRCKKRNEERFKFNYGFDLKYFLFGGKSKITRIKCKSQCDEVKNHHFHTTSMLERHIQSKGIRTRRSKKRRKRKDKREHQFC